MEAHPTETLSDVTPTGSVTQVVTPDEIPEQVNYLIKCDFEYKYFLLRRIKPLSVCDINFKRIETVQLQYSEQKHMGECGELENKNDRIDSRMFIASTAEQ